MNISTSSIMRNVIFASVPGALAMLWFFGWGLLITIIWACLVALCSEALALIIRHKSLLVMKDNSALLTGWLLGLALPPLSPWWLTAITVIVALVGGKHLFGGLGHNRLNPAMLGYAFSLIAFPEAFLWINLSGEGVISAWNLMTVLEHIWIPGSTLQDGLTAATPLSSFRAKGGVTVAEFTAFQVGFGYFTETSWEWINLAFLTGGLWLLQQRIISWHAPFGLLLGLGILAAGFYASGSSISLGSPLFHWLSGASMLAAFFIITDPVSSAFRGRDRFIIGFLAGLMIFAIRSWGIYIDGVAFAILLANLCSCLCNQFVAPVRANVALKNNGKI